MSFFDPSTGRANEMHIMTELLHLYDNLIFLSHFYGIFVSFILL